MSQETRINAFQILDKIKDTAGLEHHEISALVYAIRILKEEVETCKYNCRTAKGAFVKGHEQGERGYPLDMALREWNDEKI